MRSDFLRLLMRNPMGARMTFHLPTAGCQRIDTTPSISDQQFTNSLSIYNGLLLSFSNLANTVGAVSCWQCISRPAP
jgi:hypothetical protein